MEKVMAAVFNRPMEPIVVKAFPKPDVQEGAILAKIEIAGICGTDVHVWSGRVPWVPTPIILGHESVGAIEVLGDGVEKDSVGNSLEVGDRIYWAIGIVCGRCYHCLKGTPTRCLNRKAIGLSIPCDKPPHLFGGWAEYIYLPSEAYVFKIPDGLPSEAIAAVGCAGPTMIAGVENVGINFGDIVAVQGSGPIGLFGMILAKERGAGMTIMIGGPEQRLKLAKRAGADHTLDIAEVNEPSKRVRIVRELSGGYGPDVVLECTGAPNAIQEAIPMVRDGGRILEVGAYGDYGPVMINPYQITSRQLKVVGSYSKVARHEFKFIRFMERKWRSYPFRDMVTHRFALKDVNEALETQRNLKGMKVVLKPGME